jgi:hypothetical protein
MPTRQHSASREESEFSVRTTTMELDGVKMRFLVPQTCHLWRYIPSGFVKALFTETEERTPHASLTL